ncbi:hypothetical protein ACFQBQ_01615 [Granulicella cerasi]|uniref:FlgN protein n=1 Tax=Granulicella cerasi TaxID=741063 RepID=A0ABW1Z610_9BACT|nr:hypothetical protein [Granulicella cerasi]
MLKPLLQQSITALGQMDAERLEALCEQAEDLRSQTSGAGDLPVAEVSALKQTLFELLRTTDENLRVLRELRGLRASGLSGDASQDGELRWVR